MLTRIYIRGGNNFLTIRMHVISSTSEMKSVVLRALINRDIASINPNFSNCKFTFVVFFHLRHVRVGGVLSSFYT